MEIYKTAFPDMHRELYHVYVTGDIVGSATGPSRYPARSAGAAPRHSHANR
jgi:hypothetical protein